MSGLLDKFDFELGDIIIKFLDEFHLGHVMIVKKIIPEKDKIVISHMIYSLKDYGLATHIYHGYNSFVVNDSNTFVLRFNGSNDIKNRIVQIINYLHEYRENTGKLRFSSIGLEINMHLNKYFINESVKLNINNKLGENFNSFDLFCSSYVAYLYKIVLEHYNLDDKAFNINPKYCLAMDLCRLPKKYPNYWSIYPIKNKKIQMIEMVNYHKKVDL